LFITLSVRICVEYDGHNAARRASPVQTTLVRFVVVLFDDKLYNNPQQIEVEPMNMSILHQLIVDII